MRWYLFLLFVGQSQALVITKASFSLVLSKMPYAQSVHAIHSPQRLYPLCNITDVQVPKFWHDRSTISFMCCNPFTGHEQMRVRMSTTQPNESSLYFFSKEKAMFKVRLQVVPTQQFRCSDMTLEITTFAGESKRVIMNVLATLCEEETLMMMGVAEDPHFQAYRRGVLRGQGSDEFWIIAERVIREYSGDT